MNRQEILKRIFDLGLIVEIRGSTLDLTIKLVEALVKGGVLGIEINCSTPDAGEAVRLLDQTFENSILLGISGLTCLEQVQSAMAAGAHFLVSHHGNTEIVRSIISSGLVRIIGAQTPTEVYNAYALGADIVEIFPGLSACPAYIKVLREQFPDIPMMVTGEVSVNNISECFSAGAIAVGAGRELCPHQLAKEGRFDEIRLRAKAFVDAVASAQTLKR